MRRTSCWFLSSTATVMTLCLLACSSAVAQTDTLTSDTTISGPSNAIRVNNGVGPTTVNVVDGAIIGFDTDDLADPDQWSVLLYQDSIFNMSGGRTWTGDDLPEGDGKVYATDNAVVTITGGIQGESVTGDGNATISLTNANVGDDLEALGNSLMNVHSGNFNEDVEAEGSAIINVFGGAFGTGFEDGGQVTAEGGTIHVFGGAFTGPFAEDDEGETLYDLQALDGGVINIRGGLFQPGPDALLQFFAGESSVVTIYGTDFIVNGSPAGSGPILAAGGFITGFLADGSPLNVGNFVKSLGVDGGQFVLVQVPEPGTIVFTMIAMFGLLIHRGRRSQSF